MLFCVDKPKWITSFDVIRALKRELNEKKIWHSGTLDPMATWLLLIWTWKDTKKLHELQWLDKTYSTIIDFSKKSDTRDTEFWEYFEELKEPKKPKLEDIKEKLNLLIPAYELPLTPFNAKKKNGIKSYDLARKWIQNIENKSMKTNSYKIIDYKFPNLEIQIDVGSWTYIRSIGYRLWRELWTWWILTMLRRIKVGNIEIEKVNLDKKWTFFHKEKWDFHFTFGEIEI
jgi:tRNA pseudouridine55 synthase